MSERLSSSPDLETSYYAVAVVKTGSPLTIKTLKVSWYLRWQGWRQEFSNRGADYSDKGARIRLSGYCKCQKSPTK